MLSQPPFLQPVSIAGTGLDAEAQSFDAFDALIMLQIASHSISTAQRQIMHIQNALAPKQKTECRESLNEYIAQYVEALRQAEYEGCELFGHDAGNYFFRLGSTTNHIIVLRHRFERFLGDKDDELLIPSRNNEATLVCVSQLLGRQTAALKKIDHLWISLERTGLEIQHSLYTFSAELEKVNPINSVEVK
ncbi:MAG: hypothetical protein ACK5NY_07550 [Burkholderiaceae bacterium]|jgi:hypothetical protein